jgi:hypothetical protein
MGALAQRDNLNLTGTVVDIELTETDKPFAHIDRASAPSKRAFATTPSLQRPSTTGCRSPKETCYGHCQRCSR